MVAFKPHIKPIIPHFIYNIHVQYIILWLHIFKHQFTLVNIYGHNIDDQASLFYEDILNELYGSASDTTIMARYFNLVLWSRQR